MSSRSARAIRLTGSCLVLGVGVALLLRAALGSDGYSTLVSGASRALGVSFVLVNTCLGAVLVTLAWWRGVRPGPGTLVQPALVGATVSAVLAVLGPPQTLPARAALMLVAFPVLALGVAGYLDSDTGAGPAEAAALAFDPPVPFRWSYSVLQGGGALLGWVLGGAIGPATVLVIVLLGPTVDLLLRRAPGLGTRSARRGGEPGGSPR